MILRQKMQPLNESEVLSVIVGKYHYAPESIHLLVVLMMVGASKSCIHCGGKWIQGQSWNADKQMRFVWPSVINCNSFAI